MLPDRVSNPGPLTYESGDLPIVLHGPAVLDVNLQIDSSLTTVIILYIGTLYVLGHLLFWKK